MNQSQKRAVSHRNGPCLVLAGPGSGKTMTIVERIRYLIDDQVRPEEILVITFTKYAAAEMKTRLNRQLKGKAAALTVGTFHGIYYGILKWAYKFGPQNILSEEEKRQLIIGIVSGLEEFDEQDMEDFLQNVATEIGVIKNNRLQIDEYEAKCCKPEQFRTIYREYEIRRKKIRKIDFDDMLVLCYELFVSRPDILKKWQEKFTHILIDEFQDINQVQYDVIKMLAAPQNNLFVVGDDDQSIYGFRGADAGLMFQFRDDFPQAEQIVLDVNYRSTSNIMKNALKVIAHNEVRFVKDIHTEKGAGASLHVQEVRDSQEEAEYVCREIAARVAEGVVPESIAVLYRIHTDARALVEKLVESNISFQMKEHMPNIYEHFIARDIQSYFRLALGKGARSDLLQVMNRPARYLSRESVSGSSNVDFEALRKFYCEKDWMQDRIDQFEWDLKMLKKMAPYAGIQYMRKRIGYDIFLREYASARKLQVSDLFDILTEIEEASKSFASIEEWFEHITAYTSALKVKEQKKQDRREGIQLMTMHVAKGLEFDTVFIIQANEGRIPYKKALKEDSAEEERRLFYVAMTRAEEVLKIAYVTEKNGKDVYPSRFIDELLEGI